jgi:hypothetical protein
MKKTFLLTMAFLLIASVSFAQMRTSRMSSPSPYPGVTSDGANGLIVPGAVAIGTPVVAGTSIYTCGATATSVTVDLSKATTHLVTLSNISGVSLIFTGKPTLTNSRTVYQLDLIQPATGATVDPVWVGATAHKSATSPVTTAPNGGRDSFSLVYGTMGTTLVVYPAGPDMR